jgi:hypothetical protein
MGQDLALRLARFSADSHLLAARSAELNRKR